MSIFVNLLTISRMVFGAVIFILLTRNDLYWMAFTLFLIAGITDYLDGYLARKYQVISQIGEILDPIADKILIVFMLYALSVSLSSFYIAFVGAIIITRKYGLAHLETLMLETQKYQQQKLRF